MRSEDTLTKRGKHFQQAIEACRSRYTNLPELVRTPMLSALNRAALGLDTRYQRESIREAAVDTPEAARDRHLLMMIRHYMDLMPQ